MIKIKMIRHAKSTANEYKNMTGLIATENKYKNAGLSIKGINEIIINKNKLLQKIGASDIIIISPLKRTIQTFLYLYENVNLNTYVGISPIVSEIARDIENIGVNNKTTICDSELNKFNNFYKIDFDNDYFYYYGWKNSHFDWFEKENKILNDSIKRKYAFLNFLRNDIFKNKQITIFTHCLFIHAIINEYVNNLDIVEFDFDLSECNNDRAIKNIIINRVTCLHN